MKDHRKLWRMLPLMFQPITWPTLTIFLFRSPSRPGYSSEKHQHSNPGRRKETSERRVETFLEEVLQLTWFGCFMSKSWSNGLFLLEKVGCLVAVYLLATIDLAKLSRLTLTLANTAHSTKVKESCREVGNFFSSWRHQRRCGQLNIPDRFSRGMRDVFSNSC